MSAASNLFRFVLTALATAMLIATFNFVVDPFQIFRIPRFYQAMYSSDPRIQNAGLIRTQIFDTVFMGTSLGVHFRPSEIDEYLGGRTLKLAMSGGTSREQNLVLRAALRRGPKSVLWQLDDFMFRDSPDVSLYLPGDLYRMNIKGLVTYLLNPETTRESIWCMLQKQARFIPIARVLITLGYLKLDRRDVNELNTFATDEIKSPPFDSTHAIAAYRQFKASPEQEVSGFAFDAMARNFERDVFDLIRGNPDVEFRVYFPPYSILYFAAMREVAPATLAEIYKFYNYTLERLIRLPNVELYDFRSIKDITHDLDNYRDTVHSWKSVDRKLLSYLASGDYRVHRKAPSASIEVLKKQVEAYVTDEIRSQ
jgi:hypothetical protein